MRGGRVLLIVGSVLIVVALAVGGYLAFRGRPQPSPPPVEEGEGTPTPEPGMMQIVVAAQDIPRGLRITREMAEGESPAVTLKGWPEDQISGEVLTELEEVYDRTTRVDIVRGMPVLANMLIETPRGSDVPFQIPDDKEVAYVLPVGRYSSVAWALQPGDRVDMILSLLLVDLDEEFQTVLPNQVRCLSPSEDPGCAGMSGPMGRLEVLPNGWVVNLTPGEGRQRPRMATQLTVQDAVVLRVGDWPMAGEAVGPAGAEAEEPTPEEGEEVVPPRRASVEPLTLAVTRQDAMVLEYAQTIGARINLVLRKTGDRRTASTDSITLEYLMNEFNIALPPKLPYGVTPPTDQLQRIMSVETKVETAVVEE
jgi:Flp pilus assembly protein CpaB